MSKAAQSNHVSGQATETSFWMPSLNQTKPRDPIKQTNTREWMGRRADSYLLTNSPYSISFVCLITILRPKTSLPPVQKCSQFFLLSYLASPVLTLQDINPQVLRQCHECTMWKEVTFVDSSSRWQADRSYYQSEKFYLQGPGRQGHS